jgi:hypothetical protein
MASELCSFSNLWMGKNSAKGRVYGATEIVDNGQALPQ